MFNIRPKKSWLGELAKKRHEELKKKGYGYYLEYDEGKGSLLYPHYENVEEFEELEGIEVRIVVFDEEKFVE